MDLQSDVEALNAKVTEYNEDVQAKIAAVQTELDTLKGEIGPGGVAGVQAAINALSTTVAAGVSAVGDADADGNPPA